MTKYWYAGTTKDETRATLYAETYDAAIEHDLEQGLAGSLIRSVTASRDVPTDEEQRHRALALGAFRICTRAPGFTPVGKIYETNSIPRGLETVWIGGSLDEPQTCALIVYIQPIV